MVGAARFDANGEEVDDPCLLLATVEETFEMVGIALFFVAALSHLVTHVVPTGVDPPVEATAVGPLGP